MSDLKRNAQAALFRYLVVSGLVLLVGVITLTLLSMVTYIDAPTFVSTLISEEVLFATKLTAITTTITTAIAVAIGIPASYALSRYRVPFHALVDTIIDLPIVLPPLVAGIALLVFFQTAIGQWIETHIMPFVFTTQGIVLAQFVPAASFAVRALKSAFDGVDPRMEQVARTLGCTERQAFFRVVLPLARNGLVAGTIMTWARAAGEFGPILMFCGATRFKTEVLSIAVFLNMSIGKVEMALSVTLILVILATVALLTFRKLGGRGYLW
ncbi:MAG: ABC transporter permease subunit [Armatimonadetes bacterium]|nr:ABC transporter permease subunit [Armatimonadota bacterium]